MPISTRRRSTRTKVDTKENVDVLKMKPPVARGSRSNKLLKELEPDLRKDEVDQKTTSVRGRKRSVTTDMSPSRQPSPQKMPSPLKTIKQMPVKPESTESDSDTEVDDAEAYEKMRQENIRANAAFLTQLGIQEAKHQLHELVVKPKKGLAVKRVPKPREVLPRRRSLRIQNVAPPKPIYVPEELTVQVDEHPRPPPGPLAMVESLFEHLEEDAHKDFSASVLTSCSKSTAFKPISRDLEGFLKDFSKIHLTEDRVAKVVKDRIFSIKIHPTKDKVLVAAGDKWGRVGFWDVMSSDKHDGVVAYCPHSRPVNCLHLPPWAPLKTFSCSYDGSLRCGDFEKGVFDEVYSRPDDEDTLLRNFDFTSEHVMLVSQTDGCVAVVDVRTPQTREEHLYPCHQKYLRTVSIHPVQKHYFVTASVDTTVRLWDLRKMSKKSNSAISERRHGKSVDSAYFSPITGKYILSASADNTLNIFDSSEMKSDLPLKKCIRHDNHVGRWLTKFRATWHPAREDLFVVGSMARPRQIELYNDDGVVVQVLTNPDCLGSVCSLNDIHPSRNIVAGGNSSGRVHVFM
ncbi:WD repeat-containing protein 76-like [Haliotis rubra]|uniref:WD repeat-containing protein 76-like n=1 Tax=Haliotis rubra TaxID=36100 RepID=UPI001EE5266F|nr:WD repeat-containing protein 76-like [Haliotis rubra]